MNSWYEVEKMNEEHAGASFIYLCLFTMKELFRMPDTRAYHGAEAFEDKVLILGGVDGDGCVSDSVLEFDPEKNECHEIPSLPHPLTEMATVRWKDQIVVFGGRDEDGEVRNDVFMYDCKAGKTTTLPSMLEKRYNCCAVISGNTMVVMGGENDDVEHSSVEFFLIGGSSWKYLPTMNKKGHGQLLKFFLQQGSMCKFDN